MDNENSAMPQRFKYIVGVNGPKEIWEQGLAMYHNPNAKYPIDRNLFPGIVHGYFEENFYAYVPDFHPYNSLTQILKKR